MKLSEDFAEGVLRNNILQLCSFVCGVFFIEFSGNEACVQAADFGKERRSLKAIFERREYAVLRALIWYQELR